MAREVREYAVTIPKGTTAAAPYKVQLSMPVRVVSQIRVRVPPGPRGVMGFAVGSAGKAVIPINGTWVVTDNVTLAFPITGYVDSGTWTVLGYNGGTYTHTIYLTFTCTLPGAAGGGRGFTPATLGAVTGSVGGAPGLVPTPNLPPTPFGGTPNAPPPTPNLPPTPNAPSPPTGLQGTPETWGANPPVVPVGFTVTGAKMLGYRNIGGGSYMAWSIPRTWPVMRAANLVLRYYGGAPTATAARIPRAPGGIIYIAVKGSAAVTANVLTGTATAVGGTPAGAGAGTVPTLAPPPTRVGAPHTVPPPVTTTPPKRVAVPVTSPPSRPTPPATTPGGP